MTRSVSLPSILALAIAVGIVFVAARSTEESVCGPNVCPKLHEACEVVEDRPVCVKRCATCNADKMKPVCGFDGKSYKNKCFLQEVECMEETFIGVECHGMCPCDPKEVVALDPILVHKLHRLRLQVRRQQQLEKELAKEVAMSESTLTKHEKAVQKKKLLMNEKSKVEAKLKRKIKKWKHIENKLRHKKISAEKANAAEEELQRRITKMKESPDRSETKPQRGTCTPDKLNALPGRLIDWFHVLRSRAVRYSKDSSKAIKEMKFMDEKLRAIYVKLSCGRAGADPFDTEVMCLEPLTWMFDQLDSNKDNKLTPDEQVEFTGNQQESCMTPFLLSCDYNFNSSIERHEFCKCLCVEPPCTKAIEDIPTILRDGKAMPADGYVVPKCDEDGFYMAQQCYKDECWCVDRNGAEITTSRVKGPTICGDNTLSKEEAELSMQKKLVKST